MPKIVIILTKKTFLIPGIHIYIFRSLNKNLHKMCIRNNDNHVHVTHLTMDGHIRLFFGIYVLFWSGSEYTNIYFQFQVGNSGRMLCRRLHQHHAQIKRFSKHICVRNLNTGYQAVDKLADTATFGKIDSIIQWYEDKFGLSEVRHAQEDAIKVSTLNPREL